MAGFEGCPAPPSPSPQPRVNEHLVCLASWGGVDKPLSAEESQLCISPTIGGCRDLLLLGFQQLGTISFLTPENDLGK